MLQDKLTSIRLMVKNTINYVLEEDYNIEKIISKKFVRNKAYYLIKWEGYSSS